MTMSILYKILVLQTAVSMISTLCSNGPPDQHRPPVMNCVDPQTGGVFRTGPTDGRWYMPSYQSGSYPHPGYYASQPYPGNGYSYGHSDIRRTGSPAQMYYPSNQPASYYSNSPTYGRITSYSQAMHGSQYPVTQSTSYYPYPSNSYPVGHVYHAGHGYPQPMSPYAQRSDPFHHPFADPNMQMYSQYPPQVMREAAAVMKGHPSTAVGGTIEFCQVGPTSVRVRGRVTGIPGQPGNRGLHVLKEHSCPPLDQLPVDGKHMEHFNPLNSPSHGSRDSGQKHVGDLGNIFVQFDGVANIDFLVNQVTLEDPAFSIANHSIVITDRADDLGVNQNLESRLRGNSGRAVACGIIHMRSPPPSFLPQFSPFPMDQFTHRPPQYSPYPQNFPFLRK